jgi:CheY-like chemotaxis protein
MCWLNSETAMRTNHILLIDDSDMDNYINHAILKRNSAAHHITTMRSAEDALHHLTTQAGNSEPFPDIIFLDLMMPQMDGFGFLEKFTQFPYSYQELSTIVVLTSSMDSDDYKKAKKNPAVRHFVQKPLTDSIVEIIFNDTNIQAAVLDEPLFKDSLTFIY